MLGRHRSLPRWGSLRNDLIFQRRLILRILISSCVLLLWRLYLLLSWNRGTLLGDHLSCLAWYLSLLQRGIISTLSTLAHLGSMKLFYCEDKSAYACSCCRLLLDIFYSKSLKLRVLSYLFHGRIGDILEVKILDINQRESAKVGLLFAHQG